jgi:hypothetical protein
MKIHLAHTLHRLSIRRLAGMVLMAVAAMTLGGATAAAQNTQVTLEGIITSVGSTPGIAVGDKYSMVVYYNPTQTPSSVSGTTDSNYSQFTLNAVVDDKNGNQSFSAAGTDEYLSVADVPGDNLFLSPDCCAATAAGFVLSNSGTPAFASNALPTKLTLADFTQANTFAAFGDGGARGDITSIKVVNTGGMVPAFIVAGTPDPNGKVPAFDAVPGSGVYNLAIATPNTLLAHGSSYIYTVSMQDINFAGTCKTSFKLTQVQFNKTVTLDSGTDASFTCNPGTQWAWVFTGKTIPNFPGPANLTGTITYGAETATIASTVVIQ